jgi:hypothetical protein
VATDVSGPGDQEPVNLRSALSQSEAGAAKSNYAHKRALLAGGGPSLGGLSPIRTELELCGHSGCALRVARHPLGIGKR